MRLTALVLLFGCGRIAFDPTGLADGNTDASDAGTTGAFTEVALPSGGDAITIGAGAGPLARVYAGYKGGRVFRSEDATASWTECGALPGDPYSLAVAPDGKVFAIVATTGKLFARRSGAFAWSDDACATFHVVASPSVELSALAATPTELLAATSDGVWTWTLTGGWTRLVSPYDGVYVRDIKYDGRIVVAADTGVGVSTGTTWVTRAIGAMSQVTVGVSDPMVMYATGNGLQRTLDGGMTWTQLIAGYYDEVAVDPANAQRILVQGGNALHQSLDGGMTIGGEKRTSVMANAWPTDVLFDPAGSGLVLISTWHGLFSATSQALAWAPADSSIHAWDIEGVADVAGTRYVGTTGGLWISDDSGSSWRISATNVAQSSIVWGIGVGATDPSRVYTMGDSFARSDDRGVTFSVMLPSGMPDGYGFSAVTERGGRVWSGSETRATYSDDDGMTWNPGNFGGNKSVRALLVRSVGSGPEVVAATTSGIYWSIDGGLNYVLSNSGLTGVAPMDLVELADGRVAVATKDGVWVANAAGVAWTRVGLAGQLVHDLLVIDTRLFAAVDDGVLVSSDAGATWNEVPGLATRWPRSLGIGANNTLLVGTNGHGLYTAPLP